MAIFGKFYMNDCDWHDVVCAFLVQCCELTLLLDQFFCCYMFYVIMMIRLLTLLPLLILTNPTV